MSPSASSWSTRAGGSSSDSPSPSSPSSASSGLVRLVRLVRLVGVVYLVHLFRLAGHVRGGDQVGVQRLLDLVPLVSLLAHCKFSFLLSF